MTILRVPLKPNLGSNRELEELLKSWTEWRGEEGDSVALSRSVRAADGQTFHAVSSHDSIGAADEFRQKVISEDRYQSMISELSGLTSQPAVWELLDVIVPHTRSGDPKPYSTRVSIYPKIEHVKEVSGLLKEFVIQAQEKGAQMSLLQQVWGQN